jgi:hypothetical protein
MTPRPGASKAGEAATDTAAIAVARTATMVWRRPRRRRRGGAAGGWPAGPRALPGGHGRSWPAAPAAGGDATEPNALINLADVGAVLLGAGLLILGVGLVRSPASR